MSLITVEDGDTSRITYEPSWHWYPEVHDGYSIMSTWDTGARATFQFHGTSVSVIGAVSAQHPGASFRADFAIDGGAPTSVSRTSGQTPQYDITLFSAQGLANAPHTLVITYRSEGEIDLQIDKIQYVGERVAVAPPAVTADSSPVGGGSTGADAGLSVASSTHTSVSSSSTQSQSTTFTSLSSSLSSSSIIPVPSASSAEAETTGGIPLGALIGAIVGSLLFAALVFGILLFLYRRRSRRNTAQGALQWAGQPNDDTTWGGGGFKGYGGSREPATPLDATPYPLVPLSPTPDTGSSPTNTTTTNTNTTTALSKIQLEHQRTGVFQPHQNAHHASHTPSGSSPSRSGSTALSYDYRPIRPWDQAPHHPAPSSSFSAQSGYHAGVEGSVSDSERAVYADGDAPPRYTRTFSPASAAHLALDMKS